MKKTISVLLSLIIFISVQSGFSFEAKAYTHTKITSEKYNSPSVYPVKGEHPRILFNKNDIGKIKDNFSGSENYYAYENFKILKDDSYTISDLFSVSADGKVTSVLHGTAPNSQMEAALARLEAKAFDYVINGNLSNGKAAVSGIREFIDAAILENSLTSDRDRGYVIFISSEIYDWCYDLLTDKDIESIVENLVSLAGEISCKFPPVTSKQNPIAGHGAEAMVLRDMYSFAIAVYDEYPDIYEYIQSYLEKEYVEVRNQWYAAHSNHQGSSYGGYRFEFDMWSSWLCRAMSGEELYSPDMQYSLYQLLYYVTADGQLFAEGDYTPIPTNYTAGRVGNSSAMWLAANYFNDPYLKAEQIRTDLNSTEFDYFEDSKTPVQFLIINNPKLKAGNMSDLPKTKYFGYPNGTMIAKTGWENLNATSNDVSVYMKIGQEYMSNHQHLDFGTFQIYYKGMLTANQGLYRTYASEHDSNYNKETISHNGLLIYDPNEEQLSVDARYTETVNSGGQRRTYQYPKDYETWKNYDTRYGTVTAWGYDEENSIPSYSYISGDITNAYSDKVSEVRRSMLFIPTNDSSMPAVFFVADKIVSTDAGFKKTFLLQAPVMPEISGNTTRIKRTHSNYNGMLTVQTLFPENPEIIAQGGPGYQWYAAGNNILPLESDGKTLLDNSNLNYGWGKVLISPSVKQKEDYFLNAMYVSNSGYFKNPVAVSMENQDFIGGELVDKIALFAKSSKFLKGEYLLPIQPSDKGKDVIVTGLSSGIWEVYENDEYKNEYVIDDESSLIHFTTSGGEITIKHTMLDAPVINPDFQCDSNGDRIISWNEVGNAVGYKVEIVDANENIVYSKDKTTSLTEIVSKELIPAGEYAVSVIALSEDGKYDSTAATATLNSRYSGGLGTKESPYLISTAEEFLNLNGDCDINEYYGVTKEIDLTTVEFTPFSFAGNIYGWNEINKVKEIKNIHYVLTLSEETALAGLFAEAAENSYIGYLSTSGSITATAKVDNCGAFLGKAGKNVTLEKLVNNVSISGSIVYGGGIVGNGNFVNITIADCINNGSISSTNSSSRIGGIACVLSSGYTIERCVNYGNVSAKYQAGGIIAWAYRGTISECYNMGEITATKGCVSDSEGIIVEGGGVVGAIAGYAKNLPDIINCYNYGNLNANADVTPSSAYGAVNNKAGSGKISGYYDAKGYGISNSPMHHSQPKDETGTKVTDKTITTTVTYENCYILSPEASVVQGITALSEEQMNKKENFTDFDFDNIWASRPNSSYPYPMLKNNLYDSEVCFDSVSVLGGADVSRLEILVNLNESIYNRVSGSYFGLIAAKLDSGESNITEFGFEINGVNKKCDSEKITADGHFGMLIYSATPDEYRIRAYVKYIDGTEEKHKYLECENSLILAMPQ